MTTKLASIGTRCMHGCERPQNTPHCKTRNRRGRRKPPPHQPPPHQPPPQPPTHAPDLVDREVQHHLLERMVAVVGLFGAPRGVHHQHVEHAVARELVEAALADRHLGAVGEGCVAAGAAARAGADDE